MGAEQVWKRLLPSAMTSTLSCGNKPFPTSPSPASYPGLDGALFGAPELPSRPDLPVVETLDSIVPYLCRTGCMFGWKYNLLDANPATVGGWTITSAGTLAFCIEYQLILVVHLTKFNSAPRCICFLYPKNIFPMSKKYDRKFCIYISTI
jgi:hypothetical protein